MTNNTSFRFKNSKTVADVIQDFPILQQKIKNHRLAYLDNAATTQKPKAVIDALSSYYSTINANVHRGIHTLSEKATEAFEEARTIVQQFIHAKHARECIFVRGATEAINLVASSFGTHFLKAGDEILISTMEHHSNIVPWQMLCQKIGAKLKVIPITLQGELDLKALETLWSSKTKLLALTHLSNALGTINPIQDLIQKAHQRNIAVLIDGAQSAPHMPIDVQALDCDFFTFSGHKIYGPTGIGVLYGKEKWLEAMPPYQGGGEMILKVSFEETVYNTLPFKFEAGTPPIAEAIGLGVALRYLQDLSLESIFERETLLSRYAEEKLAKINGLQFIGQAKHKAGIISFILDGIHPHDLGTILDEEGVAIRTGHHCCMPIMDFFHIPATARASLGFYNTEEDIDQLVAGIETAKKLFKR